MSEVGIAQSCFSGVANSSEFQRPRGMVSSHAQAARFEGAVGGSDEVLDGFADDVGRNFVDVAELHDELGCGRSMVSEIVELANRAHCFRHTGVALCTRSFGQRLIGRVADRFAAELPPAPVHLYETQLIELMKGGRGEGLCHRLCETFQAPDRTAGAEHRCVLQHLTLLGGQLVEASCDQGAQRVRQFTLASACLGECHQFREEERVATTAFVQGSQQLLVAGGVAEECAGQLLGVGASEWLQCDGDDRAPIRPGRPDGIVAGAHRGDQEE